MGLYNLYIIYPVIEEYYLQGVFRANYRITDDDLETNRTMPQGRADFSEYEGGATDRATGTKGTGVGTDRTMGGPSLYSVHASSPSDTKL